METVLAAEWLRRDCCAFLSERQKTGSGFEARSSPANSEAGFLLTQGTIESSALMRRREMLVGSPDAFCQLHT